MAPLRHEHFTSLAELNQAIAFVLERVNTRPFQKLKGSRRSVFDATERAALRPLPSSAVHGLRALGLAHREGQHRLPHRGRPPALLYSVPYTLIGATVDVRLTTTTVEILLDGKRVAAHVRSTRKGHVTTDPSHRPKSHQRHLECSPSRLIHWGESIEPATGRVVTQILERFPHPEQGYRACLGLLFQRRYDRARLETACTRAVATGATSYRSVKSILTPGVHQLSLTETGGLPIDASPPLRLPASHAHVRGAEYYRLALTATHASTSDTTDTTDTTLTDHSHAD
jgi:hypothetical protein